MYEEDKLAIDGKNWTYYLKHPDEQDEFGLRRSDYEIPGQYLDQRRTRVEEKDSLRKEEESKEDPRVNKYKNEETKENPGLNLYVDIDRLDKLIKRLLRRLKKCDCDETIIKFASCIGLLTSKKQDLVDVVLGVKELLRGKSYK